MIPHQLTDQTGEQERARLEAIAQRVADEVELEMQGPLSNVDLERLGDRGVSRVPHADVERVVDALEAEGYDVVVNRDPEAVEALYDPERLVHVYDPAREDPTGKGFRGVLLERMQ